MKQARPLKRVVIKEEFTALTGDHVSAVLLNQIEYWARRSYDFDRFMAEEKERSSNEGREIDAPFMHGWIYKTAEEFSTETMMGLSANTIRSRLKKLVEKGWIGERNNPEHRWDRTKQYRFNALKVASDLEELGYHLDGWVFEDGEPGSESPNPGNGQKARNGANANFEDGNSGSENGNANFEVRSEIVEDRSCVNCGAIPEITTEIKDQQQTTVYVAVDKSSKTETLENYGTVTPRDAQQLIDYAAAKGIEIHHGYAGSYIARAGSLASAEEKIEDAAAFVANEQSQGRRIENVIGVLEYVLTRCHHDGARLTRDSVSERQKRIQEKEAKYSDVYLS